MREKYLEEAQVENGSRLINNQPVRVYLVDPLEAVNVFVRPKWLRGLIRSMKIVIRTESEELTIHNTREKGKGGVCLAQRQDDVLARSRIARKILADEKSNQGG
jgi:hypothetical protein